jgi:hypothetical protein
VFSSVNSWYTLPALLLGDVSKLRERYLDHGNLRRLFQPYKLVDNLVGEVRMYQSNPLKQRHQLREAGFELLAIVGKRESVARLFEAKPHYVVRKPP